LDIRASQAGPVLSRAAARSAAAEAANSNLTFSPHPPCATLLRRHGRGRHPPAADR
jgi:hypothetical protein